MKLAFCLFKYFPFGGLQRDFLEIATRCAAKGYEVHVFTRSWDGAIPKNFEIHLLSGFALTNVGKDISFAKKLYPLLEKIQPDIVIGFNKIQGLDVYFASDSCYAEKVKFKGNFSKKMNRRHRWRLEQEKALFLNQTHLLLIAPKQQQEFTKHYELNVARTHLLPPGIDKSLQSYQREDGWKKQALDYLKLAHGTFLILMVGSSFKTKGLDRSLKALASLPNELREKTHLAVVGKGNISFFSKLAQKLGVKEQITFVGTTPDVYKWYLSSDMLLHPSYFESAGKVILEATVTGLPVLTTANCGYAYYIEKANNGLVVPHPFSQETLNQFLLEMRTTDNLYEKWGQHGRKFTRDNDLYCQHDTAVSIIEQVASSRK